MRWILLLLVLLNVALYLYREPARQIYRDIFEQPDGLKAQGISLLAESDKAAQKASQPLQAEQPPEADPAPIAAEQESEAICWSITVDPASASSGQAGQEILKTLKQKFSALQLAVQSPEPDHLLVPDSEYHKLSPQLWERIKTDWPEVVRKKITCQAIASPENLH